mgnify:CR=1 FL=1
MLRESMREWRFYDHLRTDRDAPARRPQVGTYTPVLSGDGSDVASAVATIYSGGDGRALHEAVADGRVKQGDLVLLEAMGGGFTWGSSLIRW